jgi:NAD(P)-dependent dehydrogenase (short-subunit alcohol dehydrogenase family)
MSCFDICRQWVASGLGKEAGASVVNIASMVGKNGNLGQANYAASKAGVIGFTKTAAKELARDTVRCNVVLPGFITTPMTAAVPDKVLERIIPTVPMARMGEAEDIANAALFLASDRSSYMTGAVVEVSGGLNM